MHPMRRFDLLVAKTEKKTFFSFRSLLLTLYYYSIGILDWDETIVKGCARHVAGGIAFAASLDWYKVVVE